ncbi:hypothetical protein [Hymenobacter jeollabukensis]|uniref:Uncharacterized protein n=1 Tax=Hymenobacter jeollabukensis TaxID=2025313 RepID=A0A5R8WIR1_9BACT|nr:hypothetical protein [Hymenobacter jeollabukensis]TLM88758.1 hypothetical protein FDY95_23275 [Hymenobacter jeollabukensis]
MVVVRHYSYQGDQHTAPCLRGLLLRPVLSPGGTWQRGRNGSVLVELQGAGRFVVPGRRIRWRVVQPPFRPPFPPTATNS